MYSTKCYGLGFRIFFGKKNHAYFAVSLGIVLLHSSSKSTAFLNFLLLCMVMFIARSIRKQEVCMAS